MENFNFQKKNSKITKSHDINVLSSNEKKSNHDDNDDFVAKKSYANNVLSPATGWNEIFFIIALFLSLFIDNDVPVTVTGPTDSPRTFVTFIVKIGFSVADNADDPNLVIIYGM